MERQIRKCDCAVHEVAQSHKNLLYCQVKSILSSQVNGICVIFPDYVLYLCRKNVAQPLFSNNFISAGFSDDGGFAKRSNLDNVKQRQFNCALPTLNYLWCLLLVIIFIIIIVIIIIITIVIIIINIILTIISIMQ